MNDEWLDDEIRFRLERAIGNMGPSDAVTVRAEDVRAALAAAPSEADYWQVFDNHKIECDDAYDDGYEAATRELEGA